MSQPLLKELKELVSANIISAETAGQIEAYYQNKKDPASNRFTTALGILGALLVGIGILLVVAHNWDELSKNIQTLLAFTPLLLGQGICLFTLLKKNENSSWREGGAVFLMLAIASSISLVSQIYQVNGNLSDFLITWISLSLPLAYIMRASLVSLLCIALATWYACLTGYGNTYLGNNNGAPYFYLLVLLALSPRYLEYLKSAEKANSFHLHNWFLAVSLYITLGAFLPENNNDFEWVFAAYIALSGIYYLVGHNSFMEKERLFANPFLIIGTLGTIIIFLCWSFGWLWDDIGRRSDDLHFNFPFLVIGLLAGCAALYILRQQRTKWVAQDIMALSPFLFVAGLLIFRNHANGGMLLFNAWILTLAVYYIRKGAAVNHLGILNFGLLIFASLAIMRFFDEEIPFIWRGLFFLAAGAGFFIANSLILKKRKALAKKSGI